MKDTPLENNKLVVSTLQIVEEGWMKCHEKEYALMERWLNTKELNDEKFIKLEDKKSQCANELVVVLNSIGIVMLKISESISNEKWFGLYLYLFK